MSVKMDLKFFLLRLICGIVIWNLKGIIFIIFSLHSAIKASSN